MNFIRVNLFIFVMLFFWSDEPFAHQTYIVYSDSLGHVYLEAGKVFILIHGDISTPLYVRPKNGLLKLIKNKNSWSFNYLTESEWNQLELTLGSTLVSGVSRNSINSETWINFNEGFPAIILKNSNGVINVSLAPLVIKYIHLDVLGSVIAESDSGGYFEINNNYKPFGSKL